MPVARSRSLRRPRRTRRGTGAPLRGRGDDGFGLVELVVAMGVLAVIGLVVVLGVGASFTVVASSRQRAVATGLLSAADAQIQGASASALSTLAPSPGTTTVDGITYCTTYSSSTSGTGTLPTYTFTVTVAWPGCGGASSVSRTVLAGGT